LKPIVPSPTIEFVQTLLTQSHTKDSVQMNTHNPTVQNFHHAAGSMNPSKAS
jgi:hypothetical protein